MYSTLTSDNIQTKFPLKYLLILYCNAHPKDVYCNYFTGFKLLLEWLGGKEHILTKGKRLEYKNLALGTKSRPKPRLLPIASYEVIEIAKLLSLPEDVVLLELLDAYIKFPVAEAET